MRVGIPDARDVLRSGSQELIRRHDALVATTYRLIACSGHWSVTRRVCAEEADVE